MKRIYRHEIPVDDQAHAFSIASNPLAMNCTDRLGLVEFWALADPDGATEMVRTLQVVGTGQPLPDGYVAHWGTAIIQVGTNRVVWHLIEVSP